jgi:ABC-type sugar transport system substrate-binding protein
MSENQEQVHRLATALQEDRLSRRGFMLRAAVAGISLTTVAQVLAACGDAGSSASDGALPGQAPKGNGPAKEFPAGWNPYPNGTDPIAGNPDDAIQWWLKRVKEAGAPDDAPEVLLTEAEKKQLKEMNPRTGHAWYNLSVPAIKGWSDFWIKGVADWSKKPVTYDFQAKPERQALGTDFLINQGVIVAGAMAFDWVLFGDSMKKFHKARVATTSVVAPSSAYYPMTSVCMDDEAAEFEAMAKPTAEFLRSKGYSEVKAVWLVEKSPSWFSISRQLGFKKGIEDPAVQAICKINVVDTKPVGENSDAQAAAEAALQEHPDIHLFIMLAHQYTGAAAAVRGRGRKDVWVVASDLDEGTATSLLNGSWPIALTYSLPIAQNSFADANVTGKLLLGKQVPPVVLSRGTITTAQNVKEAYAKHWGGQSLPWK